MVRYPAMAEAFGGASRIQAFSMLTVFEVVVLACSSEHAVSRKKMNTMVNLYITIMSYEKWFDALQLNFNSYRFCR